MSHWNKFGLLDSILLIPREVVQFLVLLQSGRSWVKLSQDIFGVLKESISLIQVGSWESFEPFQGCAKPFFLLKICFLLNKVHNCRTSLLQVNFSCGISFFRRVAILLHFIRCQVIARMRKGFIKVWKFGSEPFHVWFHFQI